MIETLLHTKLAIPLRRPNLVPRPALIERLNNNPYGKLTLISAPAGFGKTTLVKEWVMSHDQPAGWLSLDEDDNDPLRFLTYFVAALQTISADLGQELLNAFQSPQPPAMTTAVTTLINEIGAIPDHIILVLDDYHLIKAEAVHHTLNYLLENRPAQLHLVITTREDPPFALHRWRSRGELTEIRERDLRFSKSETTALLNENMNLNLTADQIAVLESKTEGWISGLQLAALSLRGRADVDHFVRSFAGSNRFILDYLFEEVFRGQPPDVKDFLLQTAVLDQLNAALCDALIGAEKKDMPGSQAMLEQLEQANLFIIALDDSRQWFRYHQLFADLLRQRLRIEMGDTAVLHLRAAAWHEQNGFPSRAIKHYLAAEAWEQAAALILLQSQELQKHGENITFLRWVQALPEAVVQANPALCLEYAWALALSGKPDEAESFLLIAEAAYRDNPAKYGYVLSAQIHVARIRYDLKQTITLSRRALALIPETASDPRSALFLNLGMAYWQSGQIVEAQETFSEAQETARQTQNHHIRLLAIGFLGMVEGAQGRLHKAAELLHAALAWGSDYPASALPHLVLGALLYEWNELEQATTHLQKAITLARRSGNSELESGAQRQWALLKQALGDDTAAWTALALAESAAGDHAPQITRARNDATTVVIALSQNDLQTAKRRIEQMPAAASASIFYVPFALAPARLHLAQGNKTAAAAYLVGEYAKADQSGWRYAQIEIRLLQTLAAATSNEALVILTDALSMAQPEGFMRIFLDKGQKLIPFLHMAAGKQVLSDYTRSLLELFEAAIPLSSTSPPSTTGSSGLVEAVSEREIEVLQLLAGGRTYQEIAQAMFVSVNTVKSHLKSIYGKLGVHSRREAVARARVLHLINTGQ